MSTKGIGFEVQHGQSKPKYPYFSHISIMKLGNHEVTKAIKLVKDDLKGIEMLVRQYEITVQKDDEKGFAYFPVLQSIKLK